MFDAAAEGYDDSDWYSRFRAEPTQTDNLAPSLISDIAFTPYPGVAVSPNNAVQEVTAGLEKIKELPDALPEIFEPIVREEQVIKRRFRKVFSFPRVRIPAHAIFLIAAVVSIWAGAYLFFSDLHSNHTVRVQASHSSNSAAADVPSAVKPTPAAVVGYTVAPELPKYIDIPKLSVHARILSLGITKNGNLAAPNNVYDAGWYRQSSQPGQNGAMLIDGHISNWQAKGVFYGLNKLTPGDPVTITRGDSQQFNYRVVKTQLVSADQVDMSSLLVSQNTALPGLNLISCSGDVIPGTNEFSKRLIVYAIQS